MQKVIYKYSLGRINAPCFHTMPADAEFVMAAQQDRGPLAVWMRHSPVNPQAPMASFEFMVIPTGQEFDNTDWQHIKTFMANDNFHVWHVLRRIQKPKIEILHKVRQFRNFYECEACNTSWNDVWECAVDDECDTCHRDLSPVRSVEIV